MPYRISPAARSELRGDLGRRGLTQQDIAEEAGVTSTEVSLVLAGQRNNQKVFAALENLVPDWSRRWLTRAEIYRVREQPGE